MKLEHELQTLKNNAISLILDAKTPEELEELKLQFLGRSGSLTQLLKQLPKVPEDERPLIGQTANEVKTLIEEALERAQKQTIQERQTERLTILKKLDVTEPGIKPSLGHLHPVTQTIEEITDIFSHIGFTRVRYPEIEWDWYAFTALNFPENHPARDDWETFFIKDMPHTEYGPMLLTPHTSSGQIREMLKGQLPIRMLNIAKTYRRQSDVSHVSMFHQFETLVVDKGISIADLKGTLDYFVKSYFGSERKTRIRPYHFQFTEPSFEVDITCGVCHGTGRLPDGQCCRLCKEGWLELGGAGMVHPNVLKNSGVDPNQYSGFASGFGVERVTAVKNGLEDIREIYANKLAFLEQF